MKISIIIPAFNEENFIGQTLQRVASANTLKYSKEIIIVDDCSNDNTIAAIKNTIRIINKKNPKITIKTIFKSINEGKGAALKQGFLISTGDIILIQDADLEYNPDDYPLLLEPFLQHNADVVYGSRFISDRPHRVLYYWHYQINKFLTNLSNILTNLNLTDMETGYKIIKGDIARKIAPQLKSNRFGFEPEITARIAKIPDVKFYEVGISYYGRTYKEGKKIGWRDGIHAIFEILRFNLFS